MLKIGDYNILDITRIDRSRAWLDGEDQEIEIPVDQLPPETQEGESLRVFVYNKDKTTLAATTEEPYALVNQFAYLKVKGLIEPGALLDWGIEKDLFLPKGGMLRDVQKGDRVLVRVILNYDRNGIVADGRWEQYEVQGMFAEDDEVSLIAMETNELGTRVLVEHQCVGLVYRSEVYQIPRPGTEMTGYVLKVREDGKLDISFKRKGWNSVLDSRGTVLQALEEADGFLPLHDKSDPEEIKNQLNMSKKIFKKAVGTLYKEKAIEIVQGGIKLVQKD